MNFRGVTYFPLSWRYAHDEFGWDIKWDAKTGLQVRPYQDHGTVSSSYALIQVNERTRCFRNILQIMKNILQRAVELDIEGLVIGIGTTL